MSKPGFFIVGAPKCGTTAINDYISRHPDIFMAEKELHYFGNDLPMNKRISRQEYLRKFENTGNKKVIGEASVWYLYSSSAAQEIKAFNPDAKILIMLRNPFDLLHSLHSQHLYDGNEEETNFRKAIMLDAERIRGNYLPDAVDYSRLPPYIDSVKFSLQVKRFYDVFGKDNVHIILYEDFVKDTKTEVKNLLLFLGVSADFDFNEKVINANRHIKSIRIHRLIKRPPGMMQKIVRTLIPSKILRHRIMVWVYERNIQPARRKPMNTAFREELKVLLRDEINILSEITGRDLKGWLAG